MSSGGSIENNFLVEHPSVNVTKITLTCDVITSALTSVVLSEFERNRTLCITDVISVSTRTQGDSVSLAHERVLYRALFGHAASYAYLSSGNAHDF